MLKKLDPEHRRASFSFTMITRIKLVELAVRQCLRVHNVHITQGWAIQGVVEKYCF